VSFEPFTLELLFERYEHQPGTLVLGASDASSPTVQELFDLCGESISWRDTRLSYGNVRGNDSFRSAVAAYYAAADLGLDNVLVTVGGSEAILVAAYGLLRPGDRVLVCAPAYQPLRTVAAALGATVESYSYRRTPRGFELDLPDLLSRIRTSPAARLLVLNSPHNPTGELIAEPDLRGLLTAARKAGTTVLADEVFRGTTFGAPVPPSAIEIDPGTVVVGSLSKVFGLSGLRLGWLAGTTPVLDRCRAIRHYTSIAPPLIVQDLGVIAVRHHERLLARTQAIARRNLSTLVEWLEGWHELFDWQIPQAGLVLLARLKLAVDTEAFAHDLVRRQGVFIVPCTAGFGMEQGYVRFGLGTDPAVLREGLDRISAYFNCNAHAALPQIGVE
jgi:aspartate/methionine/tyrosine aminotransferase